MLYEFSRTERLIGKKAMDRLALSKIAIFGIGGVGSYAAEALARTGVGKLVLVDDDLICRTNINRQIHATNSTVGKPKVEVMRDRIADINCRAKVDIHQCFFSRDNAPELITPDLDYIIDAIDTVNSKIELVLVSNEQGIPIISCMGAGNKLDPTRLEIADIYETHVCPLARVMRRELRKRGVSSLKVVYSKEEPRTPIENEGCNCNYGFVDPEGATRTSTSRRQIPGSMSFVPAVAGLLMAGQVVRDLINV